MYHTNNSQKIKRIFLSFIIILILNSYAFANSAVKSNTQATRTSTTEKVRHYLWGTTPKNSLYLGMWSYHYLSAHPFSEYNYKNQLVAFNYKSLFLGTLVNSYHNRGYILALRRDLYQHQVNHVSMTAGYMLALVSGCKEGQGPGAIGKMPFKLLPVPQIYFNILYHHMGIDVAMIPSVATIGFKIGF